MDKRTYSYTHRYTHAHTEGEREREGKEIQREFGYEVKVTSKRRSMNWKGKKNFFFLIMLFTLLKIIIFLHRVSYENKYQ